MISRNREISKPTIDGIPRSAAEEERINSVCRATLSGPGGNDLMDYLVSITLMAVTSQGGSNKELREKEGQRRLVGILDARRKSKPNHAKDTPK